MKAQGGRAEKSNNKKQNKKNPGMRASFPKKNIDDRGREKSLLSERNQQKKQKSVSKDREIKYVPLLPIKDIRVSVETEEQFWAALSVEDVSMIYLDEACFSENDLILFTKKIHDGGKRAGLRLRRIERITDSGIDSGKLLSMMVKHSEKKCIPDGIMLRCMEEILKITDLKKENTFLDEKGRQLPDGPAFPEINFDYTIYGYNGTAAGVLKEMGAERLTLPIELNRRELRTLRPKLSDQSIPTELLVYGHLPMMVSANCIEKTGYRCDHENKTRMLRDRMGKNIPVRMYCKYCYNQVYNADAFFIADLKEEVLDLQPDSIRYDFSTESGEECRRVLQGQVPFPLTRGHFNHGVE